MQEGVDEQQENADFFEFADPDVASRRAQG